MQQGGAITPQEYNGNSYYNYGGTLVASPAYGTAIAGTSKYSDFVVQITFSQTIEPYKIKQLENAIKAVMDSWTTGDTPEWRNLKPSQDASDKEWFDYYHTVKKINRNYSLKDLAREWSQVYGTVKNKHIGCQECHK